ncbi:MAG: hypothetical protein U0R44_01340 [Candidatus Micrarchaeia archaeon]
MVVVPAFKRAIQSAAELRLERTAESLEALRLYLGRFKELPEGSRTPGAGFLLDRIEKVEEAFEAEASRSVAEYIRSDMERTGKGCRIAVFGSFVAFAGSILTSGKDGFAQVACSGAMTVLVLFAGFIAIPALTLARLRSRASSCIGSIEEAISESRSIASRTIGRAARTSHSATRNS